MVKKWFRVLRPLVWWLLLVLVLYDIRLHQQLSARTYLKFQVTLAGQPKEAVAILDGEAIMSGHHVDLGSHQFSVTQPNYDPFATNLAFNWYGKKDLGTINLSRSHGTLNVTANPPADHITITGPEFSLTLDDSSGTNLLVPTDTYQVAAMYPHWQKKFEATIITGQTTPLNFAPQFGALQLDCHQTDATYQLQTSGQTMIEGMLPLAATQLPAGDYTLNTVHHGHQRTVTATVKANTTNAVNCDFQYGVAAFETSPSGAVVLLNNGLNMGVTPLTVSELLPGNWSFTLEKSGYQPVQISLAITANQTNFINTNLLSETYLHALNEAQNDFAAEDYDHALTAANAALTAKPNDVAATSLQRQATGFGHLQRAKGLARTNDYVAADKELALAQTNLPDNTEIKTLLASYQPHEPAQIERERVERLARPKKVFDDYSANTADADLFESHELTTTMPAKETMWAIVKALQEVPPAFEVSKRTSPLPETYAFYANQSDKNVITTTGKRQCLIVVGQASDTETQIYFRIMEYKSKHNVSMPGLLAFKDDLEFVPIHPSRILDMTDKLKTQVQASVTNLTVRIQGAIR